MTRLLRKHQQTLLILITVMTIIAFIGFWNTNQSSRHAGLVPIHVAKIYGHDVSENDYRRAARRFQVASTLPLVELLTGLCGRSFSREEAVDNFVWNSMVLHHEALALQINPTTQEIAEAGRKLPAFQTNGAFDEQKFQLFASQMLGPNGFTEQEIDDLVRDDLRLKKIRALLDSTVELSPGEARAEFEITHQKLHLSLIRFALADFVAGVAVSDDDAKKEFELRQAGLKSDELRSIKFVSFALSDEQKKLTGKERIDELQKLANQAQQFTQDMLEKNAKFDEVAAKYQLAVTAMQPFSQRSPDRQVADNPALVAETFHRTKQDANSDAIQAENGFYVLQLLEIVPSKPLTFEEAKPKLVEQIKTERAREMMSLKASETRKKIEEETQAGKSFADAAQATGQKVEQIPPMSLAEPNADKPGAEMFLQKALEMSEGRLSEFVPTGEDGVLIHLDQREPVDEEKLAKELPALTGQTLRVKHELLFQEWLRNRRGAAKLQITGR